MSKTETIATRPDRRQVWRHIAVDRTDLPMPKDISIDSNGVISLSFEEFGELEAFCPALGEVRRHKERFTTDDGQLFSYFTFGDFLGYHGYATCHEEAPATVDYLPEPESSAKVSDTRVDEIADKLNSFVAYEYEGGTDLVNGRAVPYSDRTGVLDAGFAEAFPWLSRQDDVRSVICTDDAHEAILTDGTVLYWDVPEQQWVVAAMDAGERAAELSGLVSEHAAAVAP